MISKEEIIAILKSHTMEIMPDIDLTNFENRTLKEFGLNSIDRADVIIQTLEQLQLKAPMMQFVSARNIDELATLLKSKL